MHPLVKKRCSKEVSLRVRIGYEDGDAKFAPPIHVLAKVFSHEARTVAQEGVIYNYDTTIHIDYFEGFPEDVREIKRVIIDGVEYEVQGSSLVENPFTQKVTTLVLKI